jgi:hypothetical protein
MQFPPLSVVQEKYFQGAQKDTRENFVGFSQKIPARRDSATAFDSGFPQGHNFFGHFRRMWGSGRR